MPGIQESDRHQHIGIPEKLIKEPDSGKEKEQIMELLPESVFETALTVSFLRLQHRSREEFASELFILCRALSESKSKTQLELSANDTCALNKNKQSAVRI